MSTTTEATWTEEALQRLRRLVKGEEASAWQIGDTLLELLPIGPVGVNTGVKATIRRLAAEVDAEPKALTEYRNVAHAWPDTTRVVSATWAAHRAYVGPPSTAKARARTLESLPRNEHGKITVQAVRDLTKGNSGKPGWHELLGRVGDSLLRAQKELGRFEDVIADHDFDEKLSEKAGRYAEWADELVQRLRAIERP